MRWQTAEMLSSLSHSTWPTVSTLVEVSMPTSTEPILTDLVRNAAKPLTGSINDYDSLLDLIGDAHFVLLGEASHGTHEFYRERTKITKRLIREKGFSAVTLEADLPDAYRVHRYVQGDNTDPDAVQALNGFKRFPSWMWRNADVLDFVGWLRTHNDSLDPSRRIGLYGLDLYSLHASIERVLRYLDEIDPDAAQRARSRYACFDNFGGDPQAYGYATSLGRPFRGHPASRRLGRREAIQPRRNHPRLNDQQGAPQRHHHHGSRRKRTAQGSSTSVQEVNNILRQYAQISRIIRTMGSGGGEMQQRLMSPNIRALEVFNQVTRANRDTCPLIARQYSRGSVK
jgi:erythromycin esterase-like protein